MDTMKKHKLLFGTSICYTSSNYKTVTSDEFLDMIISKGVKYTWYFHYMPVGNDASTDLLLTPEQREYMYHRVREIRAGEGGKPIIAVDFRMTVSTFQVVLQVVNITVTSIQMVMWNLVYLSIIHQPIFMT